MQLVYLVPTEKRKAIPSPPAMADWLCDPFIVDKHALELLRDGTLNEFIFGRPRNRDIDF